MSDNQKEITVSGVIVSVTTPYAAGHTCTEAEAKALNQTRAENIGNNNRKQIKELLEKAGGDTEKAQPQAQAMIAEYDKNYEFTLASVGGGGTSRLDPLTRECRKIAKDYIVAQLKAKGLTAKDYNTANGEDALNNKIAEIQDHEKIVAAAKKVLAQREKISKELEGAESADL